MCTEKLCRFFASLHDCLVLGLRPVLMTDAHKLARPTQINFRIVFVSALERLQKSTLDVVAADHLACSRLLQILRFLKIVSDQHAVITLVAGHLNFDYIKDFRARGCHGMRKEQPWLATLTQANFTLR